MTTAGDLGIREDICAQIETINYCNRKCKFCFYGHFDGLPSEVMPMELYTRILDQLAGLPAKIGLVAFSSYAEPTIDPRFIDRLEELKKRKMEYWNITNGTTLHGPVLDYFLDNPNLFRRFFLIDVPAIDPEGYREFAGGPPAQARKVREGLHRLGAHLGPKNIRAVLTVLGWRDAAHDRNFAEVRDEFAGYGYEVVQNGLNDRAGELRPFVDCRIEHKEVATCADRRFDGHLHFGVRGNLYVCCHDFNQRFSYGDAARKPLADILASERRRRMIEAIKAQMCRRCVSGRPPVAAAAAAAEAP